jgi:predicted amidohydrolase YtcJ
MTNLKRSLAAVAALAVTVYFACNVNGAAGAAERGRSHVDAVFFNGKIRTLTSETPVAEAMAVAGGLITSVGSNAEVRSLVGPHTTSYDLGERTVLPGFIDAHAHFYGYAKNLSRIDLVGTGSLEEVLGLVTARVEDVPEGQWITGRGWDQNDWAVPVYPDRHALDRAAPHHPVYIIRVCGHAVVANSEALRIAGISRETVDPPGGRILRDVNGEPNGVLIDEAKKLVSDVIPSLTREEKKRLIKRAAQECCAAGIVGIHEMGVDAEMISLYKELLEGGELPLRLTTYYIYDEPDLDSLLAAGPLMGYAGDHLSVVGVKFYIDGSLGARSAALLADYSDDPGNDGILVIDPIDLSRRVAACHRSGFQVAVHAIGDRGNRLVLDVYEEVLSQHPAPDRRHRIEHAQIVSPEDIPRFSALGVIPSMQFTHCTSDMDWVDERLGSDRLAGAYAWRSLIETGCRIPGGSDFPVESINPLLGIYAAVTRQDLGGYPTGGWMPAELLTIDEAIRAFTIDAAYAAHEEDRKGSLAPGKLADFVVLSEDLVTADHRDIPRIEVLATVIGGEIVYRSNGFLTSN